MSCPVDGDVVVLTAATAEQLRDCDIPLGVTFRFHYPEVPMPESEPVTSEPVPPPPASSADLREVPSPSLEEGLSASMPVEGTPDLTQLEGLAGDSPALMLALAVLLVVGGGAGWRFWSKLSEQRHEQAMAKLAVDRELAGLHGAQPPPCQTAHAKLVKDIEALERRVGKAEKRGASSSLPADFDADDLLSRVERLEKAAKGRASAAKP